MKHDYKDITDRIPEPPAWWDQNGVPRYGKFTPEACPDIYAAQVALVQIECQNCQMRFPVEMHHQIIRSRGAGDLKENIALKTLHYGDPPIHDCTGDTMNSIPLKVLEFWMRKRPPKEYGFERLPSLERDIRPSWADEPAV
jgi:hypothetical protein